MRGELQVASIVSSKLSSGEDLSCRSKTHWETQTSSGTLSSFKRLSMLNARLRKPPNIGWHKKRKQ